MKGLVFDIKKFAVHDGPGIRSTLFTKGCAFDCPWCQNPEGREPVQNLVWNKSLCIGCGKCIALCPTKALSENVGGISIDLLKCNKCGICVRNCPALALTFDSQWMEPEQAVEKLLADSTFFKTSNGGITLSGGDPLFQGEFNYEVLKLCGLHRIHRTVETALFACPEFLQKFSAEVDLFLCDLKIADPDEHLKILKVSQKVVLRNLNRLIDYGKDIMIRIPLIPAFTATKKNLTGLAVIISGLGRELSVEILNFNPLAEGKFKAMNMIWPFEQKTPFSLAEMDSFRQILRDGGVKGEIK